jgi:hypothetical protein
MSSHEKPIYSSVIARNTQYDEAAQNYENKKLSILLVAFFYFCAMLSMQLKSILLQKTLQYNFYSHIIDAGMINGID